jgi:ABC-2 type transport system permease protein
MVDQAVNTKQIGFYWLSLTTHYKIIKAYFRDADPGQKLITYALMFGLFLLMLLLVILSFSVFNYLLNVSEVGVPLSRKVLRIALGVIFFMLIIGNIITGIPTLYRSKEVDWLITLPISHLSIFQSRLLYSFFFTSWGGAILIIPVILGYGLAWRANLWFFLVGIFGYLYLAILAGCIGLIILVVITRFIAPMPKWIKYLIVGLILYLLYQFRVIDPRSLIIGDSISIDAVESYLKDLVNPSWIIPSTWVEVLMDGLRPFGEIKYWLPIMIIASFFVIYGLTLMTGKLWFYDGFSGLASRSGGNRVHYLVKFKGSALRILIAKDWAILRRDPSQWAQLLIFLVLLGFYLLALMRLSSYAILKPLWASIVAYGNLGITLYFMATLALRLVFPAVSLEGLSFWVLRTSPLKDHTLFLQKFYFYSVIHVMVSLVLFGVSAYFFDLDKLIVINMMIILLIGNPVLVAINLGIGAWMPNFKERNPSRISSSLPGVIAVTISFFYLIIVISVLRAPVLHHYQNIFSSTNFPIGMEFALATFYIFLSSLAIGGFPLYLGYKNYLRCDV